MDIVPLAIPDVWLITPARHGDARGFFSETYSLGALAAAGFDRPFVQDNQAVSTRRGVVRGLHFQAPPHAQDKLLRVGEGEIFDVAVDLRRGSPTYGRAVTAVLSAETGRQLLVPAGFAHGYMTLSERTEVLYKVTAPYAPEAEGGLLWNDPDLGIDWPIPAEAASNARDARWPPLAGLISPF